jgi:lipopolysaccharide biosynthesis regulator YciM
MDPTLVVSIAIAGVLLLIAVAIVIQRRRNKSTGEAQLEYIAGLNYLIQDDYERALQKLRATVHLDTDFIDAYIKIGDVLRQQGKAENAIKVHRDLLIRPNLTRQNRLDILSSLADDYMTAERWQDALVVADELAGFNTSKTHVRDLKLAIYEQMEDWKGAYEAIRKHGQIPEREKKFRMAAYKTEQGRQRIRENREHDARVHFRDAIKVDPHFVKAYLELADSYRREERIKDALGVLRKYVKKSPQNLDLAYSRLKQMMFDLGHFGDLEGLFKEVIRDNPDSIEGHIGMADILERKGELRKAVEACNRASRLDPDRPDVKLMLIRLDEKLGRAETASEMASELVQQLIENHKQFVCETCGYAADEYFYRCPRCESWNITDTPEK